MLTLLSKLKATIAAGLGLAVLLLPQSTWAASLTVEANVNDPGYTANEQNVDRQWGLAKTGFDKAWEVTTGDATVVIAILDTGVDSTHEDLAGSHVVSGYNFLTKKDILSGTNSDDNGHGTLVAGVVAATMNNAIGIVGAAPQVSLMPVKVLDASGSGDSVAVSQGIIWATDHGADVINLSLGGYGFKYDKALTDAIEYAYTHNVVIVAAAGNDAAITGGNLDNDPVFPVCTDNGQNMVIGVTATDSNDLKPGFANFGKSCIDLAAPGRRILSTIGFDPVTQAKAPNSYAYASGTSMAAPLVSALAGLLRAKYPDVFNFQIRDQLLATAERIDNLNLVQCGGSCAGLLGSGRINAARALTEPLDLIRYKNGDLVRLPNGLVYHIAGGKLHYVGQFVLQQRFAGRVPIAVTSEEVKSLAEGSFAEPSEGTLLKTSQSPTVFEFSHGVLQPVLGSVFAARNYSFSNVQTVTEEEKAGWILGGFLPPPEGSLIRATTDQTVYWVVGGSLHPISYRFFVDRGLNIFPLTYVNSTDIASFNAGEPYL